MSTPQPKPVPAALHMPQAEYKRNRFSIDVPKGVGPEDAVQPAFYANVAANLKAWDQIELRAEDGTWYMEVMVLDASRVWARVYPILGPCRFTTADVAMSQAAAAEAKPVAVPLTAADFEVIHRPGKRWSVVRKADREVLFEGEQTKQAAEGALAEYLKRQGAAAVAA